MSDSVYRQLAERVVKSVMESIPLAKASADEHLDKSGIYREVSINLPWSGVGRIGAVRYYPAQDNYMVMIFTKKAPMSKAIDQEFKSWSKLPPGTEIKYPGKDPISTP